MIEATITLLRQAGYAAAGINEIVKASAAPKGSVYHYFPEGKKQIVGEALAIYSGRVVPLIDRTLGSARKPDEKIRALFRMLAERIEQAEFRASCAAGTVSLDLDADLEAVRATITDAFAEWSAVIASHFPIRDARRRKSFASLVLTVIEGGYIRGRAEHSSAPFREAGTWLAEIAKRELAAR
ncbi:MAG: helix-turn-helix domain-containing protein [Betaproteobacteria bacterium]